MGKWLVAGFLVAGMLVGEVVAQEQNEVQGDVAGFVAELREQAVAEGVSAAVFDSALGGFVPDARVLKADAYQPEFVRPVWHYLERALSETRVVRGKEIVVGYRQELAKLERLYGVRREVLVAIWGLETSYGGYMGEHRVAHALTTLAMGGRRAKYGRTQLFAALRLMEKESLPPWEVLGSWAGALGHTQFIPTTYEAYAVDGDGDGVRDLWGSPVDALASAAHYLSKKGWQTGEEWGAEVQVPEGFPYDAAMEEARSWQGWHKAGFRRVDGKLMEGSAKVWLLQPAGARGPAFLTAKNFRVLLRYNNATSYALAVSLLAQMLRGEGGVVASWPLDVEILARAEVEEMQQKLTEKGYDTRGVDGLVGPATRRAVRMYQRVEGLVADGFPDKSLLQRLRGGAQ